jgi:hypothetical protein
MRSISSPLLRVNLQEVNLDGGLSLPDVTGYTYVFTRAELTK